MYFVIIYAFFGCKFYSHKNCVSVKKMTIIRYDPVHHEYDNIIIVVIIFCPLDDISESHILLGAVYKLLTTRFPLGDTVPGNDLLIIIIIFAKFKSAYSITQCLLMIELIFDGLLTCSFQERSQNDRWHSVGLLPDYYRT